MEFKGQEDDEIIITTTKSSSLAYNQGSAFSKPTLSPSSSLIQGQLYRNGSNFAPSQPMQQQPIFPTSVAGHHNSTLLMSSAFNSSPAASIASIKASQLPSNSIANDVYYKYKECLRNHAANIGVHVVDGCCEFMPDIDPSSLNCAACSCHRNFHRKEPLTDNAGNNYKSLLSPPPLPQAQHARPFQLTGFVPSPSTSLHGASGVFAFGGGGGNASGSGGTTTESSSEEKINAEIPKPTTGSRKRFRTKFTHEQKEKMLGFADRIGWRIRKEDEGMIEQFCNEVGVRRQVLKVWLHNNKHIVRRLHNSDENQVQSMLMTTEQLNQQH